MFLFPVLGFSQEYYIENGLETRHMYRFTVEKSKIDSSDPMSKDLGLLTQVFVSFVEQSNGKIRCVWEYGETTAVGPRKLVRHIGSDFVELFNLYWGFQFELLYDPDEGTIEFLNYDEMKEKLELCFLQIYNNDVTKVDSATRVQVTQMLEPTYATPDIMLAIYFPEIALYFNMFAVTISQDEVIQMEYEYPNPFGGDPFPVIGELAVDKKRGNRLIIRFDESLIQDEANQILKEMVKEMSALGEFEVEEAEIPDFSLSVETKYYYNLKNKVMQKITRQKVVEIDGATELEIIEINLKD